MTRWWPILFFCVAAAWAQPKHMRVVVDTSESLCGNPGTDRSGNLKLASALLYDLARRNMSVGDTFKYSFFDPKWGPPAQGLPSSMGPEITPPITSAGSQSFLQKLMDQPYDAPQTYFAPGLRHAYEDLSSPQIPASALKVIVLLTDGLSDAPQADRQALEELSPHLREAGIKVFVLSFHSQVVLAKESAKFLEEALGMGASGPFGAVMAITPENLLDSVMEIFCRSFGWGKEVVDPNRGLAFSLTGGADLPQAAVVALYRGAVQGNFQLHAGKQNQGQIEERVSGRAAVCRQPVAEAPDSYSIAWVPRPVQLEHTFEPLDGQRPFQIAVLRPLQVRLGFYQATRYKPFTMETRALKLEALAGLENQPTGELKDIDFEVRIAYRVRAANGSESWVEDPQPGHGDVQKQATREGHIVLFTKTLNRDSNCTPSSPEACADAAYSARVRIVAKRAGIEVSPTIEELVTVYPYLHITVDPPGALQLTDSGGRAVLTANTRGAATFRLVFNGGRRRQGNFVLAARLADGVKMDGPLRGAHFRLDGDPLAPGPSGYWSTSKSYTWSSLSEDKAGHPFEVEIQVGRPSRGTDARDGPMELHLGLWDKSSGDYKDYDDLIEPIPIQTQIAEPGFWTRWGPLLGLALSLLSLLLVWLFFRGAGGIAPDVEVWIAPRPESGSAAFSRCQLPPLSPWSRWFSLAENRSVVDPSGAVLGHLRPLRYGLMQFVPENSSARFSCLETGEQTPLEVAEAYSLESGRVYCIEVPGSPPRDLRIGYTKERPRL